MPNVVNASPRVVVGVDPEGDGQSASPEHLS
jgi:hypothetical protein